MSYDIDAQVPAREGCCACHGSEWVELGNMTSNVAPLWRHAAPQTDGLADIDGKTGGEVAAYLRTSLEHMKAHRAEYEPLVRGGGSWGTYEHAVEYMTTVVEFAEANPAARFRVGR
ncbi:hypothetical protein HYP71_gp102 [Arthrobacter phage KBurrousTX]|uniref:Cytochrome c domain-containing protein n=1 Tax=Arthrobacter phage KBurrousTX TaxID=2315608 RepID=A0A386KBG0_9CAUD|nr:hypothetical protein HYP71_gp102 [Arthrobacter phage KBurrousTX]AYD81596.1 hypothetical protein KBurrousTX_102 [Arthrobacter phage KBurrousTX]